MLRILLASIMVLLAPAARAAEQDIVGRLMAEPLTLFDWGLAQLDRDIAYAAKRALRNRVAMTAPKTGSIYDWRARQITIYVAVAVPQDERTRGACTDTFNDIVATLTEAALRGPGAAGWYLLNAFRPKGHFWASRFEDVGAKLLAVVQLEVSFIPPSYDAIGDDTTRVRCVGRLDADPDEIVIEVTS